MSQLDLWQTIQEKEEKLRHQLNCTENSEKQQTIQKEIDSLVRQAYEDLPHWRILLHWVKDLSDCNSEIYSCVKQELDRLEEWDKSTEDDRW